MSSKDQNLSESTSEIPSAEEMKFGIVVSDWNKEITDALKQGCIASLLEHRAKDEHITTIHVPGTYELPLGGRMLLQSKNLDAIICIGCVIKGETKHDEYISNAVANGIMQLGLTSGKPIIFGVLTPNNKEQAEDRAGGKYGNKGVEAALTAIKMVELKKTIQKPEQKIGF